MHINYYKLDSTANQSITGVYPQIRLRGGVFDNGRVPDYKKVTTQELLPETTDLNDFIYSPGMIKTDIISSDILSESKGLFVNEKTKEILEKYSNEYIKFIPLKISDDSWYFMQLVSSFDNIDYSGSVFIDRVNGNREEKLNSYESFCARLGETYIDAKIVAINRKFDMFRIPFSTNIIISETVKRDLEDNSVKGTEISPFNLYELQ
ncbi:MAG: hypothetical protein N4A72_13845 [Bacteroidales bacterium]|jgi:hypothetical protein|nr:hypothetical protein [Bacteroidales bacterium]